MTKIITLMTALVPTIGHKALIEFCDNIAWTYGPDTRVHVLMGSLDREPVPGEVRFAALTLACSDQDRVWLHHMTEDAPQEPEDHPDFWNVWRDIVVSYVGEVGPDDIFVASELYGINMAEALGCKFLPFNRYRDMLDVKGTDVRADLLGRFGDIMPEFQPYLRRRVTIFGPESCGKTTMAKNMADMLNGVFVPEWAREYLETMPTPETTVERMRDIVHGQFAIQQTAMKVPNKPFIFQDTDLLSTLGYYDILTPDRPGADYRLCEELFEYSKADFYIVMNDRIPFEADPLRYGGDKRESGVKFWTDLLDKYGCKYYVVQETLRSGQMSEVYDALINYWHDEHAAIREYVR